jgi:hypothetical protein
MVQNFGRCVVVKCQQTGAVMINHLANRSNQGIRPLLPVAGPNQARDSGIPRRTCEALAQRIMLNSGLIQCGYSAVRVLNDTKLPACETPRLEAQFAAVCDASSGTCLNILDNEVNQPAGRQIRIAASRVADPGHSLATGRHHHRVIGVATHVGVLRLEANDRGIEISHVGGIFDRHIDPAYFANIVGHDDSLCFVKMK